MSDNDSAGWKRWRRLWRGWIIIPTGIGISVLTVLHWRRIGKDGQYSGNKTVINNFQITCYRAVPFRALSRAWGWISSCYVPVGLRCWLYTSFANICGANVNEAAYSLENYNTLCEFFVRPLKEGIRPIAEIEPVVSPADGNIITAGHVSSCQLEQIKGVTYAIKSFLGEPTWRQDYYPISSNNNKATNNNNNNGGVLTANKMDEFLSSSSGSSFMSKSPSYCNLNSPISISSSEYDMLRLDLSSAILCKEVNTVMKYNNWMLGWLIFYFRFCITVLLKNSFYIGFQLIYGIKTTNSLMNDKVVSGASFLKSQFNFNLSSYSKKEHYELSESISPDDSSQTDDNDCSANLSLHDPDWQEYKTNLLHKEDNQLYQLVVYLAPGDYHRFHSPVDWRVSFRRHFQGELLSVHPKISKWIPELFSLNERVVYVGEWEHGFFSMIAVGATNVGSIRVHTDKALQTNTRKWKGGIRHRDCYQDMNWKKGEEIGEFRLGSTIVLLFEAPKDFKFTVQSGDRIKVGQPIISMV